MGRQELTQEERVAELLKEHHLTVTTAESCTGGLIAGTLINVPGISAQFGEGYITYSNKAKERLLGVSRSTLEQYGAVSARTAEEMAEGAQNASGADISLVSTGIAGPDGGTKEKPVGLVYLGCCYKGNTRTEKHLFTGSRRKSEEAAVCAALGLLERVIRQNTSETENSAEDTENGRSSL